MVMITSATRGSQSQSGAASLTPRYSPEHEAFRHSVLDYVRRVVRPLATEINFDEPLDAAEVEAVWARLRHHGILDEIPKAEDGTVDWIALGIILELLATADASLANLYVSDFVFRELLYSILSQEHRDAFEYLFAPDVHWAGAFSEPAAGSDTSGISTVARRDGASWILNGAKLWSTGACNARVLMVACRVSDSRQGSSQALFLLDRNETPFVTREIQMLGLRGPGIAEIVLEDVRVPGRARLDEDGLGRQKILDLLRTFSVEPAAVAVGIAQHALDLAVSYARDRVAFGRPIAGFQLVQAMLAEMATEVSLGRLLVDRALSIMQSGGDRHEISLASSMAKMYCTEMAVRTASQCVQVHGAIGLAAESQPQRLLRDARMYTIAGGTTQIQTLIIGRELTGLSALR
jgi:alkylation response protein AidB-like acyl-CoA dehydrogenase